MSAARENCDRRHRVAALASGVVLSVTAMTGGITPAFAEPDTDQVERVEPTTSITETPRAPQPSEPATPQSSEAPAADPPTADPPAPSSAKVDSSDIDTEVTTATETTSLPTPSAPEIAPPEPSAPAPSPASAPSTTATETPGTSVTTTATSATTVAAPTAASVAPSTNEPTPVTPEVETTSQITPPESTTPVREVRRAQTLEPQLLQAPREDVELARSSRPLEDTPAPAPKADVEAISAAINLSFIGTDRDDRDRRWDRNVRQWDREWISYDSFHRPVILNPYRDPVRIVYVYQDAPRVVWIPPLTRIALEVAEFAAYSFTAIVLNAVNTAVNVAVGSFFGGGYVPVVGLPLPPPPPPLLRYDNVPVQVRYSQAVYEPFRVQRIIDVGDDRVYGERKVLLDGATPVWGVWTQSATGERQFEVHRTQQFPGLDAPREAPLPGDYRLRLAAEESSSLVATRNLLFGLAGVVVVLGAGALGLCALLGRRRPQH